jgi:hypothetical protein
MSHIVGFLTVEGLDEVPNRGTQSRGFENAVRARYERRVHDLPASSIACGSKALRRIAPL